MTQSKWLKKYTKIEFLPEILDKKQLHLGDPTSWDDKNDSAAIRLYADRLNGFEIRATCLTQARDRFHFWHIFGERESGVCLWFDKKALLRDIDQDASLIGQPVLYPNSENLQKTKLKDVAFTKRQQYRDEREFRVLRFQKPRGVALDKFKFSASSLERIYFNPWLSKKAKELYDRVIGQQLQGELGHVNLMQNRSLRKQDWIDTLTEAASNMR